MKALLLVVLALAAVGWVVTFPILRRGLADVGKIPTAIWRVTGYRNRRVWRNVMLGGYALGGWPCAAVVVKWRYGEERLVLRDEWKLLIEERRARHEIVLADFEEAPDEVAG
jgi:hypothetical protein